MTPARSFLAAVLLALPPQYPQSIFHPASDFSLAVDGLTRTVLWWAVAVFVIVEGALAYVLIRYSARPGQAPAERAHGHTLLEIAWTAAPTAILVIVAIPTMRTIFDTYRVPSDAYHVSAVGHQWWWEFRYGADSVATANELHLPLGRTTALELTSQDVIHSFWVPQLGGKRDMVTGRTNVIYFRPTQPGVYRGQCAEFCGLSHANMRMRVVVEDSAQFAAWLATQRRSQPSGDSVPPSVRAGYEAFTRVRDPGTNMCIICHTIAGTSGGITGPDLTHLASRTTIAGGTLTNTPEHLAQWLADPPAVKPGSRMPAIPMSDQERAALVAYLESLR